MTVLILGGTTEARELADALHRSGVPVITSLAGRLPEPLLPAGAVRIGGFGGPDGLTAWLADHHIDAVIDASHPFAQRISASTAEACDRTGVPLRRLERPGWRALPGDRWLRVPTLHAAANVIEGLGSRVLLTTGRQEAAAFARVRSVWFLVRCITAPDPPLPPRHEVLLDRGPYTVDTELALLDHHRIDLVVTKDSGGDATAAKLAAARERGLPVIVIDRPPRPVANTVDSVAAAADWVRAPASHTRS